MFLLIRSCRFPRSLLEQSNNQENKLKSTQSGEFINLYQYSWKRIKIQLLFILTQCLNGGRCTLCLLKSNKGNGIFVSVKNNLILFTQLLWMVPICRLVPESTRWLAVRGRRDEAEKILRHAAKINNRKCPDQILVLEDKDTSVGRVSLVALRSSPLLMVRCIVICLNW